MAYEMHEYLVAPARKRPQLWRLVCGLFLGCFIYVALLVGFFAGLGLFGLGDADTMFAGRTQFSTLVLLGSFLCMSLGVWLAAKALHGRDFTSLIGPYSQALRDFWSVFKICGVLLGLSFLLPTPNGIEILDNVPFQAWLMVLPVAIVLLFIQVSAEELVFRGYFQSQLAARFKSPLIWLVVPAVVFGVIHYDPAAAGVNAPLIALWAIFYGLMLGDITARAGNLGPATALHFLNNTAALLIISAQGDLSGLALYSFPFDTSNTEMMRQMLPIELALMVVMWLGARLAIKR